MVLGESISLINDWLIIHFTENYGMAFGLEIGGEYGKIFLSLFRIGAVIFITWYLSKVVKNNYGTAIIISISLILAGAFGNIIDSALYGILFSDSYYTVARFLPESGGYASFLHGKVVDMIYIPIINTTLPEWFPIKGGERFIFFRPVFNIADASITTGVFLLLFFQKQFINNEKEVDESNEE